MLGTTNVLATNQNGRLPFKLYSDHWQRFLDWAGDQGLSALPASPVVVAVAVYLTTLAKTTNVLDALTAAAAIDSVHRWAAIPSPFDAPILQLTTERILWGYPPRSPYAPSDHRLKPRYHLLKRNTSRCIPAQLCNCPFVQGPKPTMVLGWSPLMTFRYTEPHVRNSRAS